NSPPVVSAPAAFTIPQLTPFELVASATDGDGDTLSYIWEQFDLGAANTAGTLVDNGSRPLFRSFTPEAANARIFPSLRFILDNANDVPAAAPLPGTSSPSFFTGELLPSTNRSLTFRATARDNRAGGGAIGDATTELTVTTLAGPFRVTAPNTAVDWPAGSTQTVSWDVAGTDAVPVSTTEVQISLSLDGGLSWPVELAAASANDGSEDVLIPANTPSSTQARVRVRAVGNVYFDLSDADLTISGSNTPPSISVSSDVTTQQGSPGTSTAVATISDLQDVAGDLLVDVLGAPDELQASVSNSNGSVMLDIAAACTLVAPTSGVKVYPLQLLVADTDGAVTTAELVVNVGRNATPTIGQYSDVNLLPGGNVQVAPDAPPADANDNLDGLSVSPTTLPDGGSVSVNAAGVVSIQAGSSSPAGVLTVTVSDGCGAVEQRRIVISTADELFENGFE
ncbi:MAG: hypothetical protein KDI48_09565, partial [Xanthomonadales bacterium]|nr:hypothetical protein [Xanthomonadales bacterium]